jgi:hypothetical protein
LLILLLANTKYEYSITILEGKDFNLPDEAKDEPCICEIEIDNKSIQSIESTGNRNEMGITQFCYVDQ